MVAEPVVTEEGATGQEAVDGLVRLLDLEEIDRDIFRGTSTKSRWMRVFGGQVAGQGAGRRRPHGLG
jgi:acyl-CoA thioesterase-2